MDRKEEICRKHQSINIVENEKGMVWKKIDHHLGKTVLLSVTRDNLFYSSELHYYNPNIKQYIAVSMSQVLF